MCLNLNIHKYMKVFFTEIFQKNDTGMIAPKLPVRVGGVTMTPGVSFGSGVSFSGVDLSTLEGKYLDVDQEPDGLVIIKGYYN